MDDNGEFYTPEWNVRRALRALPRRDVERQKGQKFRVLLKDGCASTEVSIVSMAGEEYVCRDRMYARHLVTQLSRGVRREDIRTEPKWLRDEARPVLRLICPGAGRPHTFMSRSGVIVKSVESDLRATAWYDWYQRRRKVYHRKPRQPTSEERYVAFRKAEMLDKPMADRVYELMTALTGTEENAS